MVKICLQCRRPGFNPWMRKIPGEENGYPLQYSCPENPVDRERGLACYGPGGHKESQMCLFLNKKFLIRVLQIG